MLEVKLSVVGGIHPQGNRFATDMENRATDDSQLKTELKFLYSVMHS